MNVPVRLVVVVFCASATVSACTGVQRDEERAVQTEAASAVSTGFCEAMANLIVLLEREEGPSSPAETEATFEAAADWFEQARESAPEPIAADVANYADAYETYTRFLADSGYRLDVVFSTDEGKAVAIETSHSATPAIVDYTISECGLSFGPAE